MGVIHKAHEQHIQYPGNVGEEILEESFGVVRLSSVEVNHGSFLLRVLDAFTGYPILKTGSVSLAPKTGPRPLVYNRSHRQAPVEPVQRSGNDSSTWQLREDDPGPSLDSSPRQPKCSLTIINPNTTNKTNTLAPKQPSRASSLTSLPNPSRYQSGSGTS